jgi:hypothetical protein
LSSAPGGVVPVSINSDVEISTEQEETETDQVTSSIEEEKHTFFIRAVIDPRNGSEISVEDATVAGIIDQASGQYINPRTRDRMSIAEAMNQGKIMVEFTSRQKVRQEKKSFGLITIKTTRETRPYHVEKVVDPSTEEELSVTEAVRKGIMDPECHTYKTENGDTISMSDAIDSGLVKVQFQEGVKHSKPVTEMKTYAVNAVVDQKSKSKVPFSEAIKLGLLDKDTGMYVNNVSGEKVNVSEAIMRGFIKARVVADPTKLDIDPDNRIVVERFATAKAKIMRAVKVINTMKHATAAANGHNK